MLQIINKYWKTLSFLYFSTIFVLIVKLARPLLSYIDPWRTADWLINYQGGFVRRGLFGELIFRIGTPLSIDLSVLVTLVQVLLYASILFFTYRLAKSLKVTLLNLALILSPAFVLFPIYGAQGGFRKEILFISLMSFHSYYLSRVKSEVSAAYLAFLSIAFIFLALSHEMLVAYLPYFICGLYLQSNRLGKAEAFKYGLVLAPSGLIAVWTVLFFKGDATVVAEICSSLVNKPYDCPAPGAFVKTFTSNDLSTESITIGAISFLAQDFNFGKAVVEYLNPSKTLVTYGISCMLSVIPVLYSIAHHQVVGNKKVLWLLISVCAIATLPLLFVVADYGRLIYIHATCLTYIALQMQNAHKDDSTEIKKVSIFCWVFLALFIFGWKLVYSSTTPEASFYPLAKAVRAVEKLAAPDRH